MSNQEQKQDKKQDKKQEPNITPQPDAEIKKQSGELSEEELKKATGGTENISFNYSTVGVKYQP
jgi:hypothetical protein